MYTTTCLWNPDLLIRKWMIAMIDDLDADGLVVQARGRAPVAHARMPGALLVFHDAIDLEVHLKDAFYAQKARPFCIDCSKLSSFFGESL